MDRGGIFDGDFLWKTCKKFGYSCPASLRLENFAYIYGRADAVRLLSNVYVEDVLYCLEKSSLNRKLTGNFRYGLEDVGLRNVLKVLVYFRKGKKISPLEKKRFYKHFVDDLAEANPDFKMVSSGINFKFHIVFAEELDTEYEGGKYNYKL